MNTEAYIEQVRQRLEELGYEELHHAGLAYAGRRTTDQGQHVLALAPFDAGDPQVRARLAEEARRRWEGIPVILVFPYERRVSEETARAVFALQTPDLTPWVFDGEAELLDQPASQAVRVSLDVVRALTDVPRGTAEQTWQRLTGPDPAGPRRPLGSGLGYVPATRLILAFTVSAYLWVLLMGGVQSMALSLLGGPRVQTLLSWGANHGGLVLVEGQHWRLLTHIFLHGGLLHLGFNMWALWSLGRHVELIYGPVKLAFIYLVAGVAGGMASTMLRPNFVPSVGASGAIFGLMGALLYFTMAMRRTVDWREVMAPFVSTFVYGLFLGAIDHYAHIGGFVGGFLGAALAGIPGERGAWRSAAMTVGLLAVLVVLSGVVPLPHLR